MADQRISIDSDAGALDGTELVPLVRVGSPVTAGAFSIGTAYAILSIGTTDFTLIGAASNTVGVGFVATGIGSGTGTAGATSNVRSSAQTVADLGGGLFGQALSPTPTAANTLLTNWFNQGSATTGDGASGLWVNLPAGTGQNVTGRYMTTAPATPYSLTALVALTSAGGDGTNNVSVGIGWLDSGTNTHTIQLLQVGASFSYIQVQKRASGTASATTDFSSQRASFLAPIWFQITDDGTNAVFSYSMDGVNFLTAFTVTKASGFLGGSGYLHPIFVVGGESNNDGVAKIGTLLSWG